MKFEVTQLSNLYGLRLTSLGSGGPGHLGQRIGLRWPPGWSLPGVGGKDPPRGQLGRVKAPNVPGAVLSRGCSGNAGSKYDEI